MLHDVSGPSKHSLLTIPDLPEASAAGLPIIRRPIAAICSGPSPLPLIPGTERFAPDWVVKWHREHHSWPTVDVACYSVIDAVVSGSGQIWLDGKLVTSLEVMPAYVAQGLGIQDGGNERLHAAAALPIRCVDTPCLVALGHGIQVYGHFLIELLFRILVARRAFGVTGLRYNVLLDQAAPEWLIRILLDDLRIEPSRLEFFKPKEEQVRLRHAIISSRVPRYHPVAKDMLDELVADLMIAQSIRPHQRVFVARNRFHNSAAPYRICANEKALADTAAARHGFHPVAIEKLGWRDQIGLFRDADIVVGQAGSGLHNALFSKPSSRLASIGIMNLVQSEIGIMRSQQNAYLAKGINLSGEYRVDEASFRDFIDLVCV
jgi:capsular polysaccharide biosynthesis protein